MPYYLHLVNAVGMHTALETNFATVEQAMIIACTALRHGARNAWIQDDARRKVADFKAIQKYCSNTPADTSCDVF